MNDNQNQRIDRAALPKAYLGDAVHATWDGCHVLLTTEDGPPADGDENHCSVTNRIYLEDFVWEALVRFVRDNVLTFDSDGGGR